MKNFCLIVFFIACICVILIGPGFAIYGAIQTENGKAALLEKYPKGSLVILSNKEYVVIDADFNWYTTSTESILTIIDPKEGIRIQVDPKHVIKKELNNGNH